jgi:multisubunit Na+/H+ antiporter MnhB subunit
MIWIIRLAVLAVELGGLLFAVKLVHEDKLGVAFQQLLVESILLIIFVLTHCFIEMILNKGKRARKNNQRWWI